MPSLLLKKITLKTYDGVIFKVNEALLRGSSTVKRIVEEKGFDNVISLPGICSKTFSKVIEYLNMHAEFDAAASMNPISIDRSVEAGDRDFIINVNFHTLYMLAAASHFLNIEKLFNLACNTLAERTIEWTPEDFKNIFDLDLPF